MSGRRLVCTTSGKTNFCVKSTFIFPCLASDCSSSVFWIPFWTPFVFCPGFTPFIDPGPFLGLHMSFSSSVVERLSVVYNIPEEISLFPCKFCPLTNAVEFCRQRLIQTDWIVHFHSVAMGFGSVVKHSAADPGIASSTTSPLTPTKIIKRKYMYELEYHVW